MSRKSRAKPGVRRPTRKWTIAVYMVGGPELGPSIGRDLLELEGAGSSKDVKVVVADQTTPTSHSRWTEVRSRTGDGPAKRMPVGGSQRRTLDGKLQAFLEFVGKQYPARHFMVILWGHASGLGFGGLTAGSAADQIRLRDLANVLAAFRRQRNGQKLEILAFSACAVSKAEYALELRSEVDFLVASQIGISTLMTWPFDEIVELVLMSPSVEPASLARQMVQCYEEAYEPPPIAMTALDLRQSENIGTQVAQVSNAILTAIDRRGKLGLLNNMCVLRAFSEALDAHPWDVEPVVDFFDLCRKLVQQQHLEEPVRQQAREVLNQGFRSFVVHNARSGPKLGALNGLSILAPDFDDPNWLDTYENTSTKAGSPDAYLWRQTPWALVTRKVYKFAASNKELFK